VRLELVRGGYFFSRIDFFYTPDMRRYAPTRQEREQLFFLHHDT